MSSSKINCCDCGKELIVGVRVSTDGVLWRCEECARKQIQENDNKDKTIADLEAKLAESEARAERTKDWYNEKAGECAELKEQLAEKEKEIERLKVYDEYRFELPYPKVKILGKTFEDIQELLNKWLKQGSKDKISFAVEQLNLLYKTLTTEDVWRAMKKGWWLNNGECLQLRQTIDNQIKQLKEMK